MKKVMIIFLSVISILQAEESNKPQQAKQTALAIVASLTDTIATLIINKHYTKDPMVTKMCCVDLVTQLADALATAIIAKMEENKKDSNEVRSIQLHDQQYDVDALAQILANKITTELE